MLLRARYSSGQVFALAVWGAVLASGGCSTGRYTAAKLPDDLSAPITENLEAIDLSRIAENAINCEMIDRGDMLEIAMVTNYAPLSSTTTQVRVADSGLVDVPLVGPVTVAGLDVQAAERNIAAMAVNRGIFQKPHITVTLAKPRSNRISVVGAVKVPAVYMLPRGASSLMGALVAAGGLTEDSSPEVEIRHSPAGMVRTVAYESPPPPSVIRFDLTKAAAGQVPPPLADGDVVVVHRRAVKPIHVIGLVQHPGEFKLPSNQDLQVLDALALAGDRSTQLADKVLVIRQMPGRKEPALIEVSIREAKNNGAANLRLAPGDTVSVEDTPLTFMARVFNDLLHFSVGAGYTLL